jgi:predicted nucleic acid-binding protein
VVKAGRQAITSEWWLKLKGNYEVYISALVEEEISGGDPIAAAKRLEAVAYIPSILITAEEQLFADSLVASRAVPDALHIAIAATQGIEYLLTWNFKHINNAETKNLFSVLLKPKAGYALSSAHPKNSEVTMMKNDSIVYEVRNNGLALAARYGNNIEAICNALKDRELSSGRRVVNRAPHRLATQLQPPARKVRQAQ